MSTEAMEQIFSFDTTTSRRETEVVDVDSLSQEELKKYQEVVLGGMRGHAAKLRKSNAEKMKKNREENTNSSTRSVLEHIGHATRECTASQKKKRAFSDEARGGTQEKKTREDGSDGGLVAVLSALSLPPNPRKRTFSDEAIEFSIGEPLMGRFMTAIEIGTLEKKSSFLDYAAKDKRYQPFLQKMYEDFTKKDPKALAIRNLPTLWNRKNEESEDFLKREGLDPKNPSKCIDRLEKVTAPIKTHEDAQDCHRTHKRVIELFCKDVEESFKNTPCAGNSEIKELLERGNSRTRSHSNSSDNSNSSDSGRSCSLM